MKLYITAVELSLVYLKTTNKSSNQEIDYAFQEPLIILNEPFNFPCVPYTVNSLVATLTHHQPTIVTLPLRISLIGADLLNING